MDVQKTMEFLLEWQANFAVKIEEMRAEHDKDIKEIRQELRRAVRLSVEEHRREPVRRHQLEDGFSSLQAAQAKTEATLEAFIRSVQKGGNGHQ